MNGKSPSTWTLRESGVDVSSGGIWNGGDSETVDINTNDTDHSISDQNESERKQRRNRRRHRRSKAQKKDNLLRVKSEVNVAYDSDSKSSLSGQSLNEKSAPKQRRRRMSKNQ